MNTYTSLPLPFGATSARSHSWWPLIIGVVAVVVFVQIFPLLGIKVPTLLENRVLASAPAMPESLDDWAHLPRRLDAFAIDQFPPRPHLISLLNLARYNLGYSGSKKVIVGREGWLFYDDGSHLGMVAGQWRLGDADAQSWLEGFRQRVEYLDARSIDFYMMMAPVKEDIYPEWRPTWMPKERVPTEIDDFIRLTRDAGYSQLVDPRQALLNARTSQKLFDQYDIHWTGLGAYLGYQELMNRVALDHPEMGPLPLSSFTPSKNESVPRDLSLMLGIADYFEHDRVSFATRPSHPPEKTLFLGPRKDWTAPQVMQTDEGSGKTLLLLRDSFSTELIPLLKAHFSKIVVAHVQDGFFRKDLIEQFSPDVVILVVIETGARHSMNLMPELSIK